MQNKTMSRPHLILAAAALCGTWLFGVGATAALADDNLPDPGGSVGETKWKTNIFYENDTHYRGKDNTGGTVGLSKFRNTLQVEADKTVANGWAIHGVLRGTYDGVYRMNSKEFGNGAGGPIVLENSAGPLLPPIPTSAGTPLNLPFVPQGGGINNPIATAFGLPPTNAFGFDLAANPNSGMRVLGDRWHTTQSGIAFGVPVRPCNIDPRGCVDLGGYGNQDRSELELPEFNNRLDFIRELYMSKTFNLGDGTDFFLKLGKQQVIWGRTDLFRVLDVINPVDYSRNNIYDELQDIRIPMWIAQGEWRFGGSESMQERNLQVVWNFDKFRANNLGQGGTPNSILDAGSFFRGMRNLWDNGGTVANFAAVGSAGPGTLGSNTGPWIATDFGQHQVGLRNVNLPEWSFSNTQLGVKFEGVTKDGLNFSLNALTYRSQLPSLHAFNVGTVNPFTGGSGNVVPPAAGVPVSNLIAFDMYFPRVNLIGGSMDIQSQTLGAAIRLEGALTSGEEFPNTARPELYSKNRVFRSVIGFDRPTFVPFISTSRTTLFSAQLFYQHIFDHELAPGLMGPVGMPDWEDNFIGTLLIKGFVMNDRVSPQLILARDFKARAWAASPQVDWIVTDSLKLTFGANVKGRSDDAVWKTDDCRSCNPYPPFSTYAGQSFAPGSGGLGGLEPLGRFRAGPIGAAWKENEIYVGLRYKF
ncbi:MAG: DUF1302 domain-containing protein [Proteobacteria bacterium]|nr:DUF1302 domain-containing protein [Pseudomonadota bacterium]